MPASCASALAQAFVPVVEVACAEATVGAPALPVPAAPPASPARPALARLKAHLPDGIVL